MITIYVYTHDTMADWEIGHVTAELHSGRFFKQDAPKVSLKTVGISKEPVTSMGGLTILPDCVVDDIAVSEETVLLLPGGNTWDDSKHSAVIRKAAALLSAGGTVGAICGATAALARAGLLDNRPHTSNGAGFLEMFCPGYKGQPYFVDTPSVADGNLITAGGTGALLWAKQIIGRLGVFRPDTLEAWYAYFSTGEAQHFFALMQTLRPRNDPCRTETRRKEGRGAMPCDILTVNDTKYTVLRLLGKGKGGYSYLVTDGRAQYVLKQIHHEPCDYYTFGDKLQSELRDYKTLRTLGIPMPELLAADVQQERILKEYIAGPTVAELLKAGQPDPGWVAQVQAMCTRLYPAGLNIDYYPTNFVPRDGTLYYIDYECSAYMEPWDFEHWGLPVWTAQAAERTEDA